MLETLAPSTVKTSLDNAKAHFRYARSKRLIQENPFSELRLTIKAHRLPTKTAPMVGYSPDEVRPPPHALGRRDLTTPPLAPLLAACTGARISELAQLTVPASYRWKGSGWHKIRPAEDGGSLKNGNAARDVPLHPVVVASGFLEFVIPVVRAPVSTTRSQPPRPGRRP